MKDQNTLEIDVFQLFRTYGKESCHSTLVAIITSSSCFAFHSTFVIKPEPTFRTTSGFM